MPIWNLRILSATFSENCALRFPKMYVASSISSSVGRSTSFAVAWLVFGVNVFSIFENERLLIGQ